ncbi:MAG: HAD hydrolase family protein [Roseovarius sp.]
MTTPDILIFSDLDGTLLGHDDYSWAPAKPALDALKARGCGVVLASSKTAAEIAPLRAEMGLGDWPAIVENGSGLLKPGDATGSDTDETPYRDLRARLATLPPGFRGFGDMGEAEVAEITGLPAPAAALARERRFSEPGLWTGTDAGLERFLQAAAAAGLSARRGGRFLTLSFGGTKAGRMDEIIDTYRPRHTVALGDAPNDTEMLQRADRGVIIRNDAAPPLPPLAGEADGRISRTTEQGPAGWCHAVLALVQELGRKETHH